MGDKDGNQPGNSKGCGQKRKDLKRSFQSNEKSLSQEGPTSSDQGHDSQNTRGRAHADDSLDHRDFYWFKSPGLRFQKDNQ
jgi:hypothetical protein